MLPPLFFMRIVLFSSFTLENWNWTTPDTTGIGGSETAHIEMARRLAKRGHEVISFVPFGGHETFVDGVRWVDSSRIGELLPDLEGSTFFIYRYPQFFDMVLPKGKYYFVAQDVGYSWTEEQAEKVTGYICLCTEHAKYTQKHFPMFKGKIIKSSNGIKRDLIESFKSFNIPRNPKKIIYASSPDRGLELVLKDWFRVLEAVPDAELHVFYGMNNMEKILSLGGTHLKGLHSSLKGLLNQPRVFWRGRHNQPDLIKEMLSSAIWWYPSDWPETSCIQCMEMQACGVTPVTNRHWAVGENVFHGVMLDGVPQKDPLVRASLCREVIELLENPQSDESRIQMMEDAMDSFDWEKVVTQWEVLASA